MNYQDSVKKILVGLIMILAFAIGLTMLIAVFKGDSKRQSSSRSDLSSVARKTTVAENKLPENFPTNLPLEDNVEVTQNYNATTEDGRFQATRTYESKKTLAENLAIYREYLNGNGWNIVSTVDQPTYKKISGTQGIQTIQISLSENVNTKVKTVSISLTELQ